MSVFLINDYTNIDLATGEAVLADYPARVQTGPFGDLDLFTEAARMTETAGYEPLDINEASDARDNLIDPATGDLSVEVSLQIGDQRITVSYTGDAEKQTYNYEVQFGTVDADGQLTLQAFKAVGDTAFDAEGVDDAGAIWLEVALLIGVRGEQL